MIGYRDNTLFGSFERNPIEVAYYETQHLGNSDIPIAIVNGYFPGITEEEKVYLKQIIDGEVDEIDKWYFSDIVTKAIGERDTCLWLCKKPEDVYESYIASMPIYNGITFEMYEHNISAYEIPDDAVCIADLGEEGALYCFEREKYQEICQAQIDDFER